MTDGPRAHGWGDCREVGDRTLLDQLNAENDSAQARLALAQARVAQQLELLRLAAGSGSLDEAALERASAAGPGGPSGAERPAL